MSLLHEVSVRARYNGRFTEEWSKIRSAIRLEGGLRNLPGKNDIQKLKAWADRQGLLMDFDMESMGFTSAIRSVTFSNDGQATVACDAELARAAQDGVVPEASHDDAPVEYFDWDSTGCR